MPASVSLRDVYKACGDVKVIQGITMDIAPGEFAKNNAILVERMVGIAQGLGREIATPAEARQILGIPRPQ